MQAGKVHQTLRRLAQRLDGEGIDYALMEGMALNLWGYMRETVDIDILLTEAGLAAVHERLVGRGYVPAFEGARKGFRDPATQVRIEALITGEYPGDGKPKPVAFADPREASIDRDGYGSFNLRS